MYDYNTILDEFIQFKHFLGYKYKTDEIVINEIKKYLIENNITEITKEVTETYARLNSNISANTIARNMGVFREFCNFLKYYKDVDCYQIPNKIYPQNHNNFIPYIFSYKEIKLIYSNLDKPLDYHYSYYAQQVYRLIIKILYQTGIRIGELINIKLKDYNYELSVFKLTNTKNNEERYVAISNSLNKEISTFINKFHYNSTLDNYIFNVSNSAISKYFKKVLNACNIKITDKGPRLHDLRHTFVVHNIDKTIKKGKNINTILPILMAQLGHKTLNSLSYYFHISKDILGTVNKISEENLGYLIPKVDDNNE